MLDSYFSVDSVTQMIHDLESNPRYNDKIIHQGSKYAVKIKENLALYIFYEAIYKYKVVLDDKYLFEEYIEQLDKLFRKMDDFDHIILGINKLLCNLVSVVLDIHDLHSESNKKTIIEYLYKKYILEGYYVHGFSTVYEDLICNDGFVSGHYQNIYRDMVTVDSIFRKHGIYNIFHKNFNVSSTCFTDDFVMACYYSTVSPGYFSYFLTQNDFSKKIQMKDYIVPNYNLCYEELKKYLTINLFSPSEINFILKTFQRQWKCLNRVQKRVSILLVPRKKFSSTSTKFEDYYHEDEDVYEAVDRILSPKSRDIMFQGSVSSKELQLLSFYFPLRKLSFETEKDKKDKELEMDKLSFSNGKFMNAYGMISTFIVMGSLLITLGIIISIIMVLRGM